MLRIKDYISLSHEETELIRNLFVKEHYRKNDTLLEQGSVCRKLFFIAKGIVRYSQLSDGEERTYVFRAEGAFCNDLESFLEKTPARSTITAIESTTVYSITYDNLQVFYSTLAQGERFGRLAIEQIFVMVVNHLNTFYSETPEQRYLRFASNHKDFLQRVPQYLIASYIGVTPQALCRIKKKLLMEH